jgi:hypothetical protein
MNVIPSSPTPGRVTPVTARVTPSPRDAMGTDFDITSSYDTAGRPIRGEETNGLQRPTSRSKNRKRAEAPAMRLRMAYLLALTLTVLGCSSHGVSAEKGEGQLSEQERIEVLDFVFKLQFAAEAGNAQILRELLDEESLSRLVYPGSPSLEDSMEALRTVRHPARFKRILRMGETRIVKGKQCHQIILPREGRYGYLDGPIEPPFQYKQIDFWLCVTRKEGALKAYLHFPLNDLTCLIQ